MGFTRSPGSKLSVVISILFSIFCLLDYSNYSIAQKYFYRNGKTWKHFQKFPAAASSLALSDSWAEAARPRIVLGFGVKSQKGRELNEKTPYSKGAITSPGPP